jgi:FtsH-binding integral membrane protein
MSTRADSITFEDEKGGMLSAPVHSDSVEKMLRIGFVKKVYGILTAQLFLTFGMIFVFVFVEPVKVQLCGMSSIDACSRCPPYVDDKVVLEIDEATDPKKQSCMWLQATETPGGKCNLSPSGGCLRPTPALQSALITAVILSFVFICGIACCEKCARQVPTNYIVLFSFTACEAVMLGITCLFADAVAVGMAAGMTGLVTAGLTAFAWFTKVDFTGMGGYLYAALLSLIVFGFVAGIFGSMYDVPLMQNLYAGCGCLIFSMFIVYDTQLIAGSAAPGAEQGGRKYAIGYDDYVFAALNIYLDIINLFIYLLQILNDRN